MAIPKKGRSKRAPWRLIPEDFAAKKMVPRDCKICPRAIIPHPSPGTHLSPPSFLYHPLQFVILRGTKDLCQATTPHIVTQRPSVIPANNMRQSIFPTAVIPAGRWRGSIFIPVSDRDQSKPKRRNPPLLQHEADQEKREGERRAVGICRQGMNKA